MTMRIYTSADASAPTLQGIVGGALSGSDWADGSLLQLLRKVLVTGYGTKTAAGWTQSFSATSHGTFRQGGGCLFYLDVLDDGSLTAGARETQFVGMEVATAVGVGTGLFPTVAQQAAGLKFRKSDTADTTTRPWICFADASTFYLYVQPQTATPYWGGMAFGNFHSLLANDAYNCMAIGRVTSAIIDAPANEAIAMVCGTGGTQANTGHYMARGYSQGGASVNFGKLSVALANISNTDMGATATGYAYPNTADQGFYVTRCLIVDNTTVPTTGVRGWMKGMYAPFAPGSGLPLNYPFAGSGTLAGKTLASLSQRTGGSANGRVIMETSDTWDS